MGSNSDFRILLEAKLDAKSIPAIQKQLLMEKVKLSATLDLEEFAKSKKSVRDQVSTLSKEIKHLMGDAVSSKEANQWAKEFYKQAVSGAEKADKAQNKLINAMGRVREATESARRAEEKRQATAQNRAANKALDDEYQKIQKINKAIAQSKVSSDVSKASKNYNSLATAAIPPGLKTDYETLISLSQKLNTNLTKKDKVAVWKEYQQVLAKVKNEVKQLTTAETKLASEQSRYNLTNRIKEFADKNSKTMGVKAYGSQINGYLNELNSSAQITKARLEEIRQGFVNIEGAARRSNKLGRSFMDSIKDQASKFGQWFGITAVIMKTITTIRQMVSAVYEVDTAMTNLYKVTDETDRRYSRFLDNANKKAQELGRTTSSFVTQSANWAKLGFNVDESAVLAEYSSIYSNVGEVDDATAVSDMVTAMKSFNIEATDAIDIIDSLNILGNKFATDSASLGEGLRNSAAALNMAGNDIHESLAMLTGATEITQNASETGNSLKILSMRIRGMKGNLEELGEEYENVGSISKIQTQILNRTMGTVNIFDDQGNFRSTYEILQGIAEVWDRISQTEQAKFCLCA